jgi:hypothetical protein
MNTNSHTGLLSAEICVVPPEGASIMPMDIVLVVHVSQKSAYGVTLLTCITYLLDSLHCPLSHPQTLLLSVLTLLNHPHTNSLALLYLLDSLHYFI